MKIYGGFSAFVLTVHTKFNVDKKRSYFYTEYANMLLTSSAAQTDLHSRMQAALIVEKVRKMVEDTWNLERFPVCELLQKFPCFI